MGAPTYTYTLTNGQTADADQVQQNFSDILNGVTDATKNLNCYEFIASSSASFDGSVTLGNGAIDQIVIQGSLGNSILILNDGTYDLGSATAGMRAIYFGDASGDTANIVAPTLGGDITLTLPAATGTFATLAGTETLTNKTLSGFRINVRSITSTDTAVATDDVILITSGTFSLALTAVASMLKKPLWIRNVGSGLVTIDPNASETIDSSATMVLVQNEAVCIIPDATNWKIIGYTSVASTYTPGLTNSTNAAASTSYVANYIKVKNIVTVTGRIDVDPTTNGTNTLVDVALPFATDLTSAEDVSGVLTNSDDSTRGYIAANTSTDKASFACIPVSSGNAGWFFSFSYLLR